MGFDSSTPQTWLSVRRFKRTLTERSFLSVSHSVPCYLAKLITKLVWKSASCFEAFRQTDHFKNTFWPPLCRLEEPYIQAFGSSSGAGNLQQWFTSNCSGTGHYTRFLQIIKVYTKTPVSDHTRFKLLKETGVWVGLVPESEEAESRYYYSQSRFPVNIWMNETETIDQGEAQVMFCIHYWTSAEAESMAMKIPLELFTEIQVSPLPTPSDQEEAAFPNREADKLELHGLFDPPSPNSSLPKCSISYMIENASFGSGTLPRERLMSQLQASEVLDWTELHAEFKRITLDRVGRPAARATGHEWSQRAS